jgi:RNA polymerase sigma factor (sigma-70 family)
MDFESLVEQHLAVIEATIRRIIAHHRVTGPDADDLRSTLLVHVLLVGARALRRFEGRSSVETYLFRILHREAIRWKRRQFRSGRVQVSRGDSDGTRPREAAAAMAPNDHEARLIHREALRDAIMHVPTHDRRLVFMRLKGHSFRDISRGCGLPIRTVETAVYRALGNIRATLDPRRSR